MQMLHSGHHLGVVIYDKYAKNPRRTDEMYIQTDTTRSKRNDREWIQYITT